MFNCLMDAAVSIYQHQFNLLFNFDQFYSAYESASAEECRTYLVKVEQAFQDEDLKEALMKSKEILKILFFL